MIELIKMDGVRADVRDIRQTDGRTTDADDRLMPRLPYGGGGIINYIKQQVTLCQFYLNESVTR